MKDKIKLYIISGFLGSGKTTFLKRVLQNFSGEKLGVLVNEFGVIGVDGSTISKDGIEYVEIRSLDINVDDPAGINQNTMRFMESFLIYCLLEESPPFDTVAQDETSRNQSHAAREGRDPEFDTAVVGPALRRFRQRPEGPDRCPDQCASDPRLDDDAPGLRVAEPWRGLPPRSRRGRGVGGSRASCRRWSVAPDRHRVRR